jgi:hypothetical protein
MYVASWVQTSKVCVTAGVLNTRSVCCTDSSNGKSLDFKHLHCWEFYLCIALSEQLQYTAQTSRTLRGDTIVCKDVTVHCSLDVQYKLALMPVFQTLTGTVYWSTLYLYWQVQYSVLNNVQTIFSH